MQQKEFEMLTGKTVTAEEYEKIENAYVALPDMDKYDFCEKWAAGELTEIVCALSESVKESLRKVELKESVMKTVAYSLLQTAQSTDDEDLKADIKLDAIKLVGYGNVVKICLEKGYPLSEQDRRYILAHLN